MAREDGKHESGGMGYGRFAAMIATSTVVMFGLMYLNTYLVSHAYWSETRGYMALLMGATMAIIMLAFMLKMYSNKAVNAAIFAGAAIAFALTLWLVRSQATIGDASYMRAMIPHHSIAIMTSSRANISDPRVRKLADEIIYAQDKEIAEMRWLISDLDTGGVVQEQQSGSASIVSLEEALSSAHLAVLDPGFLTDADLAQLFPDGPACTFSYTQTSPPVLAIGDDGAAFVKLSGDLVQLDAEDTAALSTGPTLTADGITLGLTAPGGDALLDAFEERQETDLTLSLDAGLRAGYRGVYGCAS
ncbi:hypothetical protein GCM10011363_20280 [Marivita lacus]|uniref:DUF305 domain-containing protein n=2 Tax=Marivita lacus TaxID=1323742 RepID=A0ABQ1KM24_9RHOB|nr:hypothetical protein GCM10011363_20280 [Marivita lacus]